MSLSFDADFNVPSFLASLGDRHAQQWLCEKFDVPSDSLDIHVELKEQNLARYEIAPIALDAELNFTIWVHNDKDFDVYYCGMYEPGSMHHTNMQTLKSPPELPDV